jgi:hypothetical protein
MQFAVRADSKRDCCLGDDFEVVMKIKPLPAQRYSNYSESSNSGPITALH